MIIMKRTHYLATNKVNCQGETHIETDILVDSFPQEGKDYKNYYYTEMALISVII